jgi:hypothetical protein
MPPREPARRRRLSRALRWLGLIVGAGVVFALGVALGQALDDNPEPDGLRTRVRTLTTPLTLEPARETVTVTVTSVP